MSPIAPQPEQAARPTTALPRSLWEALTRGMFGKCPRCEGASLFRKWLKPVDRCACCGQDWSVHEADDFPPYISIFVTGHLIAPLIIALMLDLELSVMTTGAIVVPVAAAIMLGILQPAKGATIALQWWHGMAGFTSERLPETAPPKSPRP